MFRGWTGGSGLSPMSNGGRPTLSRVLPQFAQRLHDPPQVQMAPNSLASRRVRLPLPQPASWLGRRAPKPLPQLRRPLLEDTYVGKTCALTDGRLNPSTIWRTGFEIPPHHLIVLITGHNGELAF
jgi:hypothetical protein